MQNEKKMINEPSKVIVKTSARYKSGLVDQLEIEITLEEPIIDANDTVKIVLNRNLKLALKDIAIALEGIDLKIGMSKVPIEKFLNEKIQKL